MNQPDELNEYLKRTYYDYISGSNENSLLLWSSKENGFVPSICSLISGFTYNPLMADQQYIKGEFTERYVHSSEYQKMIRFGKSVAKLGHTDYMIVGYPNIHNYKHQEWEGSETVYPFSSILFYVITYSHDHPDGRAKNALMNGWQLRTVLQNSLQIHDIDDVGTQKVKNSSIHDYFQYWSRNYLSRKLVKVDIDGGFFENESGNKILVEIKRSKKPPLHDWRPYKNDYANYLMEYQFCKQNNIQFWLLHHEGGTTINEASTISLFEIEEVGSLTSSRWITYNSSNYYRPYLITLDGGINSLEERLARLGLNRKGG